MTKRNANARRVNAQSPASESVRPDTKPAANGHREPGSGCKRCTTCNSMKKLEEFHKQKRAPDGRKTCCRACKRAIDKRRRVERSNRTPAQMAADRARIHKDGKKKCSGCKDKKDFTQFGPSSGTRDALNCYCIACQQACNKRLTNARKSRTDSAVAKDQIAIYGVNGRKRCWNCKVSKRLTRFNEYRGSKDGLADRCKRCMRAHNARLSVVARRIRDSLKHGTCTLCKWTGPSCAFDFAHKNRKTKRRTKYDKPVGPAHIRRIAALIDELPKCTVLCVNCHRVETDKENKENTSTHPDAIRTRARMDKLMKVVNQEKTRRGACVDCQLPVAAYPFCVFDFDHRPENVKLNHVSQLVNRGAPPTDIIAEMKKCDLRCGRCHRAVTEKRFLAKAEADAKAAASDQPADPDSSDTDDDGDAKSPNEDTATDSDTDEHTDEDDANSESEGNTDSESESGESSGADSGSDSDRDESPTPKSRRASTSTGKRPAEDVVDSPIRKRRRTKNPDAAPAVVAPPRVSRADALSSLLDKLTSQTSQTSQTAPTRTPSA